MRAGRTGRIVGRVVAVGLLGLGVSALGGQAAQADADDYTWESVPATGAPVTDDDYTWENAGDGATALDDYTWE